MAGRDRAKLEQIKRDLVQYNPAVEVGIRALAKANGWHATAARAPASGVAPCVGDARPGPLTMEAQPLRGPSANGPGPHPSRQQSQLPRHHHSSSLHPPPPPPQPPARPQAVPVIVADVFDYSALAGMAQSTSVVINVAGPCEPRGSGRGRAPAGGRGRGCRRARAQAGGQPRGLQRAQQLGLPAAGCGQSAAAARAAASGRCNAWSSQPGPCAVRGPLPAAHPPTPLTHPSRRQVRGQGG